MLPLNNGMQRQSTEWVNDPQDPLTKVRTEVGLRADALAEKFFKKKAEEEHKSNVPTLTNTNFRADDFPYVMTTEVGQAEALKMISSYPKKENGLFLGFAFEFNYHLLAERSVNHAFICDINKRMHTLYHFIAKTIVVSETRESFLQALQIEFEENKEDYFGFSDGVEKVFEYFTRTGYSWLSSDEKFLNIKQLYLDKKIHHLNLDLEKDSKFFEELKKWAADKDYVFDSVYVSNIPEWIVQTGNISSVKENLLKIVTPKTLFIDAKLTGERGQGPVIRITTNIQDDQDFPSFDALRKRGVAGKKRRLAGIDHFVSNE